MMNGCSATPAMQTSRIARSRAVFARNADSVASGTARMKRSTAPPKTIAHVIGSVFFSDAFTFSP